MLVFRQYELACLSHFSYLIGDRSSGRAVVVDPQRDIHGYLADAAADGLRIERVIETHFHADFLSGHLELAAATGATISYGDVARPDFAFDPLADGQVLTLGEVTLEIRHTPGHTPESISIVVRSEAGGEPWAVLTGDALFVGDVGRPDLLVSTGRSADSLARDLFRSLHSKLLTLPDATLVYPAHGAGSACGKALSSAASSTIGEQRATNPAFAALTEDEFVVAVTSGQPTAPPYFAFAAAANRKVHDLLDDHAPPPTCHLDEAIAFRNAGAVLIDTRTPDEFAAGHLDGSINVGLDGRFAEYAGDVVRPGQRIVVLGDAGRGAEAKVRLARIGFDNVVGSVDGIGDGLRERPELAAAARRVSASAAIATMARGDVQLLDVRGIGEIDGTGTLRGAHTIDLAGLLDRLGELDSRQSTIVFCASGYRSSIAASVLRAHGFADVADVPGGYPELAAAEAHAAA